MRKFFLRLLPAFLLGIILLYSVVFTVSVREKVNSWNAKPGEMADSLLVSPEEWELVRDKTFLLARIAMAGNDSIGLTVNLRDSLVQIENKGVVLRQVKYGKATLSRFFRSITPSPYTRVFSKLFRITEIEGSVLKEPIVVKKAPRDSSEVTDSQSHIDTSRVEFIEWHLQLDSSLVVSFVQSERRFGNFDWPTWKYRFRQHFKTLSSVVQDVIHLRKPSYYPEITIYLPRQEAKSFYRALPPKGLVVLRF